MDYMEQRSPEAMARLFSTHREGRTRTSNLREQVVEKLNYPTPQATEGDKAWEGDHQNSLSRMAYRGELVTMYGLPAQTNTNTNGNPRELWTTPVSDDTSYRTEKYKQGGTALSMQAKGKLNPRWVETLMNLPIGWTMPSCAYPMITVQTNSGYLVTELYLPQPKKHF
jgi:hypothetical protein